VECRFDRPAQDWLEEEEFAAYLGTGLDLFRRMVKAEMIPPARKWTHKRKVWSWETAVWVSIGLRIGTLKPENLAPRMSADESS